MSRSTRYRAKKRATEQEIEQQANTCHDTVEGAVLEDWEPVESCSSPVVHRWPGSPATSEFDAGLTVNCNSPNCLRLRLLVFKKPSMCLNTHNMYTFNPSFTEKPYTIPTVWRLLI